MPVTVAVIVLPVSAPSGVPVLPVPPDLFPAPFPLAAPVDISSVTLEGSVSVTVVGVAAQ